MDSSTVGFIGLAVFWLFIIAVAILIMLLPAIIAFKRKHAYK